MKSMALEYISEIANGNYNGNDNVLLMARLLCTDGEAKSGCSPDSGNEDSDREGVPNLLLF